MCMLCRLLFVLLSFFVWPLCCLSFDLRLLIIPLVSLVLMIDYQTNVAFHINYIHYYLCHLSNPPITFLYCFNPTNCVTFYHLCRNRWVCITFARNYFHYPFQNYMPCTTHVCKTMLQIRIQRNKSLQKSS